MKTNPPRLHPQRGQSFTEMAIMIVVLVILGIAFSQLYQVASLSHRIASSAREGGRIFIAEDLAPTPGESQSNNESALRSSINSLVYSRMQGMIEPGDLDNQGKMIFSILVRRDGYDDDPYNNPKTDYSDKTTEVDDYIEVEYQFDFPQGSYSSWTSKIGSKGSKVRDSDVNLGTLRIDERTVCVEIYHEVNFLQPVKAFMNATGFDHIYDRAIF
jgi:hypothetical protein